MKQQRLRFRVLAFVVIGLLVLAAAWPLLEEIGQRIWSVLG